MFIQNSLAIKLYHSSHSIESFLARWSEDEQEQTNSVKVFKRHLLLAKLVGSHAGHRIVNVNSEHVYL